MSILGDAFGPVTTDIIESFGQLVTVQGGPVETSDQYDPTTGRNAASPPSSQSGFGLLLEYQTYLRAGVRNEKDSLIRAGDKQLFLAPVDVSGAALTGVKAGAKVTVSGVAYSVTAVAPMAPDGVVIYYECNIRGAGG